MQRPRPSTPLGMCGGRPSTPLGMCGGRPSTPLGMCGGASLDSARDVRGRSLDSARDARGLAPDDVEDAALGRGDHRLDLWLPGSEPLEDGLERAGEEVAQRSVVELNLEVLAALLAHFDLEEVRATDRLP